MDASACNYDAAAELDNGSCEYAEAGFEMVHSCADTDNGEVDSFGDGLLLMQFPSWCGCYDTETFIN